MGFPGLPTNHIWYSLGQWGWANVKWCEATLMGTVTEPANTWSNAAFLIVGLFLLTRKNKDDHVLLKIMPWSIIALGFLSGFYHATNAWITQLGDFVGMYLVASIPFLINLERLGHKKAGTVQAFVMMNIAGAAFTAISYYVGFPIQAMFAFFFVGILSTEMMLLKTSPARGYQNFFITLASFAVAITFSALDHTRTMCDPHNHVVQGHALWHCFSGVGLYFAHGYVKDALGGSESLKPVIL